ncbi:hypothetical protein HD806DRAFT_516180 [Xylariaceae sp. AK1471]|nr:hypothetical protein HD806DRAFT_516180 [Xylariaceae sp. AK1471]
MAQVLGADQLPQDDASTLGGDALEISPNMPNVDKSNLRWHNFQVGSLDPQIVLEGWEIISVRPTTELANFKRIFGVNIYSTYKMLKDGYTGVRAIPSYSQAELAHMVAAAESEWNVPKRGISRLVRQNSYVQDLARRVFELPACLPSKLGALLDCRFVATNKSPHFRREWKIVMLKPITDVMTDDGPRAKKFGRWGRHSKGQSDPVQKWLVVLRGQNTRISEEGFAVFNTASNPWLKVDERLHKDEKTP